MNTNAINRRLRTALPMLSEADRLDLATKIQSVEYPAGEVILQQGAAPGFLYIVDAGRIRLTRNDQNGREVFRQEIGPGEMFGRYAMLNNTPQRTTAQAETNVRLLQIRNVDFNRLVAQYPDLRNRIVPAEIANRLRSMPIFRTLDDDTIRSIAELAKPLPIKANESAPLIDNQPTFYLIDTGQIQVGRPGIAKPAKDDPVLSSGNFFGEEMILARIPSTQAIVSGRLLGFKFDDFGWLQNTFPTVASSLSHPDIPGRLHKVPLFSKLNAEQLRFMAAYFSWEFIPGGRDVMVQGTPGDDFKILDDGEAVVRAVDDKGQERPRSYMHHGDSFGETTLFLGDRRDASVQSVSGSVWLSLSRQDFKAAMDARPDVREAMVLKPETERRLQAPHYDWMDLDETIILNLRRHWFILVARILPALLIGLLLIIFISIGLADAQLRVSLPYIAIPVLLVDLGWVSWVYIDWSNDWLIVTNKRIVQIEKVVLTSDYRFEAPLDKVQNAQVSRGAIGQFFNFGILTVQTAALPTVPTAGRILFTYLPDPDVNQDKILGEVNRARARSRAQNREAIRQGLQRSLHTGLEVETPETVVSIAKPAGPTITRRSFTDRTFPFMIQESDRVTWRKHWVNLLERALQPFLVLILLGVLLVASIYKLSPLDQVNVSFLPELLIMGMVAAAFGIWYQYADWYNDVYIVTRDRIIDLEQTPLLGREERREANLANVQNVTLTVPGFWANILDYGTVVVQTAGQRGSFDFKFVGNPRQVQSEIFKRIQEYQVAADARQAAQRQAELQQWFEIYNNVAEQK